MRLRLIGPDVTRVLPRSSAGPAGLEDEPRISALAVKGDLTNKDGMRAAMAKADFPSVRGSFKFGNNHFPIQDFYLREVVADADGNWTTATRDVVYKDHQDPYAKDCKM